MDQNRSARLYFGSSTELPDLNVEIDALVRSKQCNLEVGKEDNGRKRGGADVEGKYVFR
jgi:hypothetical protein